MAERDLSRRDFLKWSAALPLSISISRLSGNDRSRKRLTRQERGFQPNILIILFDALPALNMSLYGYPRETTPVLESLGDKAITFHNHYSAGNFTSPSTASLLTGTYPWSHRAINMFGTVASDTVGQNVFRLLPAEYHSIAYTQNPLADMLLLQFRNDIRQYVPLSGVGEYSTSISPSFFSGDLGTAFLSEIVFRGYTRPAERSNLLSFLLGAVQDVAFENREKAHLDSYPLGIPDNGYGLHFRLDRTLDWIVDTVSNSPSPFFGYFHLFPPHFPYCPTIGYFDAFDDGWTPKTKPASFFSEGRSVEFLTVKRQRFDEYLLNIDAEFGRFMDNLRGKGVLEDTIIILTSDHGQMFERGIWAHMTPALFEPLLRVPLMVWDPNRQDGGNVKQVTSAVDLLPTIARMVGQEPPSWCDGNILPQFGLTPGKRDRRIFAVEAKSNAKLNPLVKGTVTSVGHRYKLVRYFGYEGFDDEYLMFDLENDPAERENIYSPQSSIAQDLRDQLVDRIEEENSKLGRHSHP